MDDAEIFKTRSILTSRRRKKISRFLFCTLATIAVIIIILSVIVTFIEL